MAKADDSKKDEIKLAIGKHLALNGPTGWPDLMAKYPDVSRATFFRYIKEVRESIEAAEVTKGAGALKMAQQRIRTNVAPERTMAKVKAHLPVMPSPAVIADDPQGASRAFKFFQFFETIVEDSDMMRAENKVTGPDGRVKVRNPAMMDRIISRRLAIAETYLHAFEAVYNAERIRELYEIIVEEVGKASPDIQQAVLVRMRELDNKRGLTMNGAV